MLRILIVEDDEDVAKECKSKISAYGVVHLAHSVSSAREKIKRHKYTHSFIDLTLEKKHDGFDLIKLCKQKGISVAALTSETSQKIINKVLKELKADRYFDKIYFFDEWSPELLETFFFPKIKLDLKSFFENEFITVNKRLIKDIENVVDTSQQKDRVTLLMGPTGVGKTTLASMLHKYSLNDGPFIDFNVNQVAPDLLESTLFGHKKGSFTGAYKDTKGLLQLADGGTLFLDEISDISIQMQQKLLTAIENKEIRPIGSEETVKTEFKLICAGKNIFEKVKKGSILPDFYYRIHDIVLNIEPLHKRVEDIEKQIYFFLKSISKKRKMGRIGISDEALFLLKNYVWHGNTRELSKELNALVDNSSNFIDLKSIPKKFIHTSSSLNSFSLSEEQIHFLEKNGLKKFMMEIENQIVKKYIDREGASKLKLSKFLGVNKQVIYRMAEQNSRDSIYEQ